MSDGSQTEPASASPRAAPWLFIVLVFLLSIPFFALGAAGGRLPIATFLPVSALMAFVPMIAALVLVYRESGVSGAKKFLSRALDYRKIKGTRWALAAFLLMPMVFALECGVQRLQGTAPPDVQFFSVAEIVAFALMFFVGGVGEELGWQGYAFAGLKNGRSALEAALIIGVIWALWHVIPFAQMGRGVDLIIWQCLGTIALRVIIVWLFVNAGQSVFVAVLIHTMTNMPWGLFPNFESHFDPFVLFVILALVAVTVVALWGPSTLARFRHTRLSST
jgi:membrane protease YdiL (CAAX protease family)